MFSEYNSIRARLYNSQTLLEGTDLVLFTTNETTLVRWYKNSTRRCEITSLMRGVATTLPPLCAFGTLPPTKQLSAQPPSPPTNLHPFPEPEDTSGQAVLGRRWTTRASSSSATHLQVPTASISSYSTAQVQRLTASSFSSSAAQGQPQTISSSVAQGWPQITSSSATQRQPQTPPCLLGSSGMAADSPVSLVAQGRPQTPPVSLVAQGRPQTPLSPW